MTDLDILEAVLKNLGGGAIAVSGGVDSMTLATVAGHIPNTNFEMFHALSPAVPAHATARVRDFAKREGWRLREIIAGEFDDPSYRANPVNRCYFCKVEVYGQAVAAARRLGIPHVLDGFNRDDRGDHRPGRQAAREQGVRSPLDELGFTKANIREAARRLGLPIWDKPALACLSSRFPYGIEITPDRLEQVAASERVLRNLGFGVCRVRHHGATARLEVEPDAIARLSSPKVLATVTQQLQRTGFTNVEIDPLGYRSGSLNATIPAAALKRTGIAP